MSKKFICLGPHFESDRHWAESTEVFEYLGCFCHEWLCKPNRHKHSGKTDETFQNGYEETKERQRKIENADYAVVANRCVSL